MKHDCTNCGRQAAGDAEVCGACDFSDTRPPTNWEAISAPTPVASPDTWRLEWLLPLMTLADDPQRVGDKRTLALSAALVLGKTGRDAIDYAMEGSP